MNDFLEFYNDVTILFPLNLQITQNKVSDWCIYIYKKRCAGDYHDSKNNGNDVVLVNVQSSDMEFCFAKAHVELKEWLIENKGGY